VKSILVAAVTLCISVATTSAAQSNSISTQHLPTQPERLHGRILGANQGAGTNRSGPARLPDSASGSIIPTTCPPEATGAICGYVPVPLDRTQSNGVKINIYFEMYAHSSAGPAESAIFVNQGGPGFSTTISRGGWLFILGPNLDVHDVVLVDDRGRGLSGALNCPELQQGTANFAKAEADCAAQLGNAASRYGTGDIAQDTNEVRAALGYDLIDFFSLSYGGMDIAAFATRFGKHVRSIVMDAPVAPPILNELQRLQSRTHSDPTMVKLDCLRSPTCAADHPGAAAEFAEIIKFIREHPVSGDAHDAFGNLVHINLNENSFLNFVVTYPSGDFTSTGEILAAGAALRNGDSLPMLRLAAEGFFTLIGNYGDPTINSAASFYATGCVDTQQAWPWSDTIAERKAEYADVVEDLPNHFFYPFPNGVPSGILFSLLGQQCLWWQRPTPSSPVVGSHPNYPSVPTLVLDGDLDNRAPHAETMAVAAQYPNSTSVTVTEAGHETVNWSQCATGFVSEFIENLKLADTSCANTPEIVFPAVGRFPLVAADARPAQVGPGSTNEIATDERRVVTVAVATATDVMQRSFIGSGSSFCLRAGQFNTNYGNTAWTATIANCAFAEDVIVNGTVTWQPFGAFTANLTVSGPGTAGGTLQVQGSWQAPGPVGNFQVSGTLGGKQVAVIVPEA
jgi:pimeloyl-ACP methyl ester carboxylesterase